MNRQKHAVRLKLSAKKDLASLPIEVQRRVSVKIDALAEEPRPVGCEKLAGSDSTYRLRSGDYRVVYEIDDDVLTILVIKVGHRRDVYR